jgi:hypothetical protein
MPDCGSELSNATAVTPVTWTDLGEAIRQLAGELENETGRDGRDVEHRMGLVGESWASRVSRN